MKRWTLIALAPLIAAGPWLAGATMGPYAMSREPRFPQLTMEQLSDAQKPLAEQIVKVSSVGLGGPYNPLLRSPVLGQRIFDLFHYLRWETSVPLRLNEFAILIIGRQWRSQVEWFAHAPLAIKAGLAPAIVADLKANRRPANMPPEEAAVYDFVTELTTRHEVSDETFDRAKTAARRAAGRRLYRGRRQLREHRHASGDERDDRAAGQGGAVQARRTVICNQV